MNEVKKYLEPEQWEVFCYKQFIVMMIESSNGSIYFETVDTNTNYLFATHTFESRVDVKQSIINIIESELEKEKM